MKQPRFDSRPSGTVIKEPSSMLNRKRPSVLAFCLLLFVFCFPALSAAPASAAPSPWWQVLTGSRPTHLWEPEDSVQRIETEIGEEFGFEGSATRIVVGGKEIGCLATANSAGSLFCGFQTSFAPTETAAELEALLEASFGTSAVEVSGGPVGGVPFVITVPKTSAPVIGIEPLEFKLGSARSEVISEGGSGRLFITVTNLGDAPVDATVHPVTVVDELPEGVSAGQVEAFSGAKGQQAGPVDCTIEGGGHLVSCSFEGTLPSYEAIEIEVGVSLEGSPPVAGPAGSVTVEGGNAPPAFGPQEIQVTPGKVPFGIERFSAQTEEEGGTPATQAGSHPFQFTTTVQFNSGRVSPNAKRDERVVDQPALPRNFRFELPVGMIGNAKVIPTCELQVFYGFDPFPVNKCPSNTVVGAASVTVIEHGLLGFLRFAVPVFNLPPAHGEPARFGFLAAGAPVVIDTAVDPDNRYRIIASVNNASQVAELLSSTVVFWGAPGDARHDSARGWNCVFHVAVLGPCEAPFNLDETAFLREPVSCTEPRMFAAEVEPWNVPFGSSLSTGSFQQGPPTGCNQVPFDPQVEASPSSSQAESPSGLHFKLKMPNLGLLDKDAISEGQAKRVEVTLPEGVTINPSQANGLGGCSPAQYAKETAESAPGEGCPEDSKIGSIDISTPLLAEEAHGALYVATPHDNPFGSLLALYMVAKIPQRGILVKQAGKVELNPQTGQVLTTFDDLPQIPFDTFDLHFFEGAGAPLVMPSSCGQYDLTARFTPWNAADPNNPQPNEIVTRTSSFTVDRGPNGGACPSGTPPFKPGFTAGTQSNAAGKYSPLDVRLTRDDGEQEFRTFSLKMPKGVIGKLAGIPFCSDVAIAAARARTGPNGGQEELDHPSCPDPSQIGRTLVGAGVGPTLTYAPGKLYLAGPYKGTKLSVVAITTAKVGPFDLGNVVIRQGLKVDPDTAVVSTDGSSSDPIPHILQGIVVHARDIRIFVDRKDFVLNPTSCERMKAAAAVLGSGNTTADVSAPFQAADCARLGFKPKLSLSLMGGTRRGAHPRLKAVLKARKGDANIGAAVVKLPHSEFLEQGHIRTICTRVQFAAGSGNGSQCPKGSIYGRAKAITPLLDEPLAGPVYLRSSNHALPDLVAALHSKKVDINLDGRIDAVNGGIRNSFEAVPDAPVTKFVLEMQGGKKGLLVNSTNVCQGKHRARASFTGQNGKQHVLNPLVKARCGGKHKRRSKH
jgi:hypothetical protein